MNILPLINKFCSAIWEYDSDTCQVYLHYDDMTPELCGRWISYNKIEQLYRKQYVYPLDLNIWNRFLTPEGLLNFLNNGAEEEHFYIRFEHTQKGNEWHEVYFQRIESNRLVLASRDVNSIRRNAAIAQAVVPEYDYVCCIDVNTQSYVLYYSDSGNTVVPQSASDNYHKILEEFNKTYVVPEQADSLTKQMRLENVVRELEHKSDYILYATTIEHGSYFYKKLRFSYENNNKKRLLLTRTDVTDLIKEQKLRKKEQEKRLQYLENMPVAFCSVHVLLDEKEKPLDFQFTYCNRAHEKLEGVERGQLLGKNFYEFFEETDPEWLNFYYETAYKGIHHIIQRYSPEIQKHLLIYTFQLELGHCECAMLDVSEQYFLSQELENSHRNMKQILKNTTDLVFQYLPEQDELILEETGDNKPQRIAAKSILPSHYLDHTIEHSYWEKLERAFLQMKNGDHSISAVIRARLTPEEQWNWYRVVMFDFQDGYTHERKILGFFQNIDQELSREEELRKKAQTDSLTGIFNAGTGKQKICQKLSAPKDDSGFCSALFVIDMDDFKAINDTYGHLVGDKVLIHFSQVLRRTFRSEDIIYRLGGDEFVVFIEKIHEPEQSIGALMHRFHMHMEKAKETYPFLSCSIGVFVTDRPHSFDEYYTAADQALYESKKRCKGNYTIKRDE